MTLCELGEAAIPRELIALCSDQAVICLLQNSGIGFSSKERARSIQ
jgi:hypothetical protein